MFRKLGECEGREREGRIVKISKRRVLEIGEGDLDSLRRGREGGVSRVHEFGTVRSEGKNEAMTRRLGRTYRRGGALVFTTSRSPPRSRSLSFLVRFNFYEHPPPTSLVIACLAVTLPAPCLLVPTEFFFFFFFFSFFFAFHSSSFSSFIY